MELKPGYKYTDVGVIPWEQSSLGDKSEKIGSGITPTGGARVYKQSGRPFLRSQNIGWGRLLMDDVAYIDEETHESFKGTEIQEGDVLLTITGASIGRSAVANSLVKGGNVNQHVCIIRPKSTDINPYFLSYFLLSENGQRQIDSVQAGGNREGLNFGQIKSFRIPLPPLDEQRNIAVILSEMDALLIKLESLIAKKRNIKQAAMQQLITGTRRLPGFNEKWEVKILGDIVERIVGGGTPSRSNPNFWGAEIPWVTVKDFATFDPYQTQEFITSEGLKNSASNLIPKGTVIISTRMALGKAVIYKVDVSINQDLKAIFPNQDVDSLFLYYWFQTHAKYIESLGSGSTVRGISLSDLKNIEFMKTSLEEQRAIAEVLTDMDAEIKALEVRLEKTRELKLGLTQELLSGRKRLV